MNEQTFSETEILAQRDYEYCAFGDERTVAMLTYTAQQKTCIAQMVKENAELQRLYNIANQLQSSAFEQLAALQSAALRQQGFTDEQFIAMGRVVAQVAGEDWDNIGEFAQGIIIDIQRSCVAAAIAQQSAGEG